MNVGEKKGMNLGEATGRGCEISDVEIGFRPAFLCSFAAPLW